MNKRERRNIEFDELNLLGKAVFLAGSTARLVAGAVSTAVRTAESIYEDAEAAFIEGIQEEDNVSEARIISESEENSQQAEDRGGK